MEPIIETSMEIDDWMDGLSAEAKAVAGAWFGLMGTKGKLTFTLETLKPSARAQAGLDELVAAGIINVQRFNGIGGLEYRPLRNCRTALSWLARVADGDMGTMEMTAKITGDGDRRAVIAHVFGQGA